MSQAFALSTIRIWQTNKQKKMITTYQEFLGTWIKSKKKSKYAVYIN